MVIPELQYLKDYVPDLIYQELVNKSYEFGMSTPVRAAHILGQIYHETNGFKAKYENLNYSAAGLTATFGNKLFPPDIARVYAYNPIKIANRAYGNKGGNGPESSGDGYKYRGRGPLQLTLKNNYKALKNFTGVDVLTNPDLVATELAVTSALFYFKSNNIWEICDKGINEETIMEVTKKINKKALGFDSRASQVLKFATLLRIKI